MVHSLTFTIIRIRKLEAKVLITKKFHSKILQIWSNSIELKY